MQNKSWIAIFKAGTHTDSNGGTKTWTEKDLDHIVNTYKPSEHEAPVVIGHPKKDSPAYGWVELLKREGNMLYSKFKDLIPEFVEMVKKGMFKKRSISLYPDGRLKHVGFLGATPPAVKGLPDYSFSEREGVTIEFDGGSEIRKEVDLIIKKDQLTERIANLIFEEMKKNRGLNLEDAFRNVVNDNPDILVGLREMEAEQTKSNIMKMGIDGMLDILTKQEKGKKGGSYSQAFSEIQTRYPELITVYVEELRNRGRR